MGRQIRRRMTHRERDGGARRRRSDTQSYRRDAPGGPPRTAADPAHGDRVGVARALSKLGAGSRRDGERWVEAGRVRVNGRLVHDPTLRIDPRRDRLTLDGAPVRAATRRYYALHKPRGVVVSRVDERGAPSVYSLLPPDVAEFVAPVGRLDRASEGLLLFTNDTRWANALLAPSSHVPKTYHVQVDVRPHDALVARLLAGLDTPEGERLAAAAARVLRAADRSGWLELVLHEGRNRHIRRMLAAADVEVRRLIRVAVGPLALGSLARGALRPLADAERDALARAAGVGHRPGHDPRL
ncbi:pseudouridine synthase [Gemmatimonadetes bacterium T265]|nr:pseudouridine synthase [Gemmatimonadetes bacterium T265]